ERREDFARRSCRIFAREMFETFCSDGHGRENRSPLDDVFLRAKLRVFDVAAATLPRAMKVLDAPSLRVAKDDFANVFDRVDGMIRKQKCGFRAIVIARIGAS